MTEIDQLRKDIEQAKEIMFRFYNQDRQALGLGEMYDRLAKLEAEEAAKADPWKNAKWQAKHLSGDGKHDIYNYANRLEQRIAELEAELARRAVADKPSFQLKLKDDRFYDCWQDPAYAIGVALSGMINNLIIEPYTGEQK